MTALRLAFFVLLSLAIDLGTPQVLEALEIVEGEEAVHRPRGRKAATPRLSQGAPSATRVVQTAPMSTPRPAMAPSPRPVTGGVRKVPPPLGESQSAPDDH
jgi:hypothetical protein